jgi:hypothetical protein
MYSIPKDGDIVLAIRNVLARYKVIRSQRELRERVERELNFGGGNFHAGGTRIRMLAVISGVATLKVHTKTDGKAGRMDSCPVCRGELKASRNMTVYGKTVTVGYRCAKCEYWTGADDIRRPSRYEFRLRKRR